MKSHVETSPYMTLKELLGWLVEEFDEDAAKDEIVRAGTDNVLGAEGFRVENNRYEPILQEDWYIGDPIWEVSDLYVHESRRFDDVRVRRHHAQQLWPRDQDEPIAKSQRGRKPKVDTQSDEITKAYDRLVESGAVDYRHGGLTKAAMEIGLEFPNYQPDSIRKLIQPDYNAQKSRINSGRQE